MVNFWQGRKVLLTGHTGFKGSWLSLWLQLLEADLMGIALSPPTHLSLFELADVAAGMTNVTANIQNFDSVWGAFEQHKPEIVIHMAAQPLVRQSYHCPIETYATNVLGTVHVLEAARKAHSVKAIVNVTTDKCYENQEWLWGYRENDRLGGHDPYSNSKACAELVTNAYRLSYFTKAEVGLASARAGNVIGGGDWADDRLIPDIIRACIQKIPISIRNPASIRPWQHVLEPLSGYLMLAEKLYREPSLYSQGWNFGPNEMDVKPVSWIADFITQQWQQNSSWYVEDVHHLHEATYLKLDCSKAIAHLAWKPRWNLEKSLLETIEWYKAFVASENMRQKTISQILNFMENTRLF